MAKSQEHWDQVRAQFDALPYPNLPLEHHPGDDRANLATHNYVIPYYFRNQQVINTQEKWILDAGCGSGYKLLALAVANPGAHLVGIDISQKSLDLTQQRLEYHKISNTFELHCLPIEDLPNLPYRFDYINCDDVLYLLEDPTVGLQAMKSVLKPEGIIRANMHSALQRVHYYRVQEFLSRLGGLVGTPTQEEIDVTRQTMATLHDWVNTKRLTWASKCETDDQYLLMNYLFRGDRGITMTEFSAMLRQADLEFISMLNWREWKLEDLFKSIEELPISVALGLADMSAEEHIQIYELLHPVHRLLDLYCGHPGQGKNRPEFEDWSRKMWDNAVVHLHPQLNTSAFKQALEVGTENLGLIPFGKYLNLGNEKLAVDSSFAACLYGLLEGPKAVPNLVKRWLQVRPLNLITLEPASPQTAFNTVRNFLVELEFAGYLMIELPQAS